MWPVCLRHGGARHSRTRPGCAAARYVQRGENLDAVAGVDSQHVAVDKKRGSPAGRPPGVSAGTAAVATLRNPQFQPRAVDARNYPHGVVGRRGQAARAADYLRPQANGLRELRRLSLRPGEEGQIVFREERPAEMVPGACQADNSQEDRNHCQFISSAKKKGSQASRQNVEAGSQTQTARG